MSTNDKNYLNKLKVSNSGCHVKNTTFEAILAKHFFFGSHEGHRKGVYF